MRLVAFFLCLGVYCSFLDAKIVETAHFQELSSYASSDTLLVLDIDDTLLVPAQMLGSDEWFQYRWKKYQKEGKGPKEALEKSIAEWESIRHLTQMEVVEQGTEKIIQNLQKNGCCLMGLTTQTYTLSTTTPEQLLAKNMDLLLTAPKSEELCFFIHDKAIFYRKGILFTSGGPKGEALFQFCDKLHYHPKRIVFINDKASHLEELERVAAKKNVEFIGLRYSYSDSRKKAFSPEIADYQLDHSSLSSLLSDREAKRRLENERKLTLLLSQREDKDSIMNFFSFLKKDAKEDKKTFENLKVAAKQESLVARLLLIHFYLEGIGTPVNYEKAKKWMKQVSIEMHKKGDKEKIRKFEDEFLSLQHIVEVKREKSRLLGAFQGVLGYLYLRGWGTTSKL